MVKNQTALNRDKMKRLIDKYRSVPDLMVDEISTLESRTRYGDQLIHIASVTGSVSDIEDLLSLGADVNSMGEAGYTPLHYAAEQGHLEVVKALMLHGANLQLKDENGETALQLAEQLGNKRIADYLKELGSDQIDHG